MTLFDVTWAPISTALPAGQVLAGTTLAAFQAWPLSAQVSFIKANGTGNPPQAVLGPAGSQYLATLTLSGEVATDPPNGTPLPANFTTVQPADVDWATFTAWSPNMQTAYLQANGGDPTLALGSGTGAFSATRVEYSASPSSVSGTDVVVSTTAAQHASDSFSDSFSAIESSASLTTGQFLLKPQDYQESVQQAVAHLRDELGNSNHEMVFSDASYSDHVATLTLDDGSSISVALPASSYPGFSDTYSSTLGKYQPALTPINSSTSSTALKSPIDADTFAGWPAEIRKAYLLAVAGKYSGGQGQVTPGASTSPPIAVVFGPSTQHPNGYTATLMNSAAGAQVQIADNPANFDSILAKASPQPSAQTFLSWPAGAQLAYTLANTPVSYTLSGSSTSTPLSLSVDSSSSLTVTRDSSAVAGLTMTYNMPNPPAASSLSPALFSLATASAQAYALTYNASSVVGTGVLAAPSLLIGTGSTQALVSSSGGETTVDALPANFGTSPSGLSPTQFLSWPPVVQQRYLYLQKTATAAGTTWNGATFSDGKMFTLGAAGQVQTLQIPLADFSSPAPTVGDSHPYEILATTTGAATLATQANQIFSAVAANPWVDTSGNALSGTPDPSVFDAWTSEQQAAYIKATLNASTISPKPTYVTLGSGTGAEQDVFLSSTVSSGGVSKVYTVQNLQKTSIATMSYADQTTLAAIPAFLGIAGGLNLIPATTPGDNVSTTAAIAAQTVAGLLSDARKLFTQGGTDLSGNSITLSLPPVAQAVFTSEIDVMAANLFGTALPDAGATTPGTGPTIPPSTQTTGSAIFSTADLKTAITAIEARFRRANAFAAVACNPDYFSLNEGIVEGTKTDGTTFTLALSDVMNLSGPGIPWRGSWGQFLTTQTPVNTQGTSLTAPSGVSVPFNFTVKYEPVIITLNRPVMLDGNVSVTNGYLAFMNQEKAILTNRVGAATLASTGKLANSTQNLDLPSLLCLFMMFNSNAQQAIVTADSEEVNQTNAILQDYAVMQSIINTTNSQANGNAQLTIYPKVGNADANAMYMFAQNGKSDYIYNESPIEILYLGPLKRPTFPDYYNGDVPGSKNSDWQYTATWTEQGTQLSDTVTQLNQQSQIKMNDITNETKQQDRFFDLASTSLSKLNETLAQIASAT